MKFAASLLVFSAAYSADAHSPYPENNNTILFLECGKATFDQAGAAASGSPTSASDCATSCKNDKLYDGVYMDNNGHAVLLSADKYAGCSFPSLYYISQQTTTCMFNSAKGNGFFATLDYNVMLTKDDLVGAFMWPRMTTAAPGMNTWQIYRASAQVESCPGVAPDESWITGNAVSAPAAKETDRLYDFVNLTAFYKSNDPENGKMHFFAVPGNADDVLEPTATFWAYTWSTGPVQVGVSTACGAITDCANCVKSCHWCQLSMGGVTSGLCGVTQGQCHAQQSPSGSVSYFSDQCSTPVSGASSAMMLSVAGAVLLGAAVAL